MKLVCFPLHNCILFGTHGTKKIGCEMVSAVRREYGGIEGYQPVSKRGCPPQSCVGTVVHLPLVASSAGLTYVIIRMASSPPHRRAHRLREDISPTSSSPIPKAKTVALAPIPTIHARILLFISGATLVLFGALSLRSALSSREIMSKSTSHHLRGAGRYDDDGKTCRNENTQWLTVDSRGVVCENSAVDESTGCCIGKDPKYLPWKCEEKYTCIGTCCSEYAMCVSCCLLDDVGNERRRKPFRIRNRNEAAHFFTSCSFNCRTNSDSLVHENAYRSIHRFCYGMERPPINEDLYRGRFDFAEPQKRQVRWISN